ncbi:T-cell immunoreceptor with Ig and ITIM domains [Sciurus carolinensis]|uniref:T-cell immunoreceptor with Ig and ITIM domains n=1 Tax=Sciurus carolinensis TaxID=30640 RepID=UPI001FB1EFDF|nr:T-cell immunoreceptor with Ig and ITIM domains [Sciurus carolinensis]
MLSFALPSAVGQFWSQKRPHLLPVGPLGRSMHWCLLLIWAQGLRQALFASAMTGTIVTKGNISAEEGGSVILQCHLSSTMAEVTQVNWEQRDQLLAICHTKFGWYINPVFSERVTPGPRLGLTFQSLTMNDTGEYFCIYHTYPDGIYEGSIFLEVLGSSVAEHSAGFLIPLLAALGVICMGVVCIAVIRMVALARKKTSLRIHSAESDLRRSPSEQQEWSPSISSSPGSCVQAEATPAGLCSVQREDDYAEPHDYFNVLSYRSLGSFNFLTETG